jgi:hypothetical protein
MWRDAARNIKCIVDLLQIWRGGRLVPSMKILGWASNEVRARLHSRECRDCLWSPRAPIAPGDYVPGPVALPQDILKSQRRSRSPSPRQGGQPHVRHEAGPRELQSVRHFGTRGGW